MKLRHETVYCIKDKPAEISFINTSQNAGVFLFLWQLIVSGKSVKDTSLPHTSGTEELKPPYSLQLPFTLTENVHFKAVYLTQS